MYCYALAMPTGKGWGTAGGADSAQPSLQGPKDIYLGMTGALLGTIPTAFLYFSTYEWCKERLTAKGHSQVTAFCAASFPPHLDHQFKAGSCR